MAKGGPVLLAKGGILLVAGIGILYLTIYTKRRNAQNRFPLYGFGAILGVFFRYERLHIGGGILTVRHSKAAVCRFRVTKKRRIATTLLSYWEVLYLLLLIVR